MQADTSTIRPPKLILIHGMLSTPLEFGLMAQPLRARGIAHVALEIEGYTQPVARGPIAYQAWLAATRTAIDAAIEPGEPIILAGLCMGGVIAAAIVQELRYNVQGLIMMSPTFTYDGWALSRWTAWRKLGYLLHVDRFISVAEREPFGIKNPKIRKWIARDMQASRQSAAGPATLPLRAIREGERLMRQVARGFAALCCPVLVMHAREDEITSLKSVEDLFGTIGSVNKSMVVLEQSYHMITIDNDRARVALEIQNFVRARAHPSIPVNAPSHVHAAASVDRAEAAYTLAEA